MPVAERHLFNRSCCGRDTFFCAFLKAAYEDAVPLLLVDRCLARRRWRQGLTGREALMMIRKDFLKEIYRND